MLLRHQRYRWTAVAALVFAAAVLMLSPSGAGAAPSPIAKARPLDAAEKGAILAERGFRVAGQESGAPAPVPGDRGRSGWVRLQVQTAAEMAFDPAILAEFGAETVRSHPRAGVHTVAVPAASVEPALAALRGDRAVKWAGVPAERRFSATPDDTYYERQWPLPLGGFPAAWDLTTGNREVVIAVLDTGVAGEIPDLADKVVDPYSVAWNTAYWPAWEDVTGHGSAVASIAAAQGNDGAGIAGAAWDVSVMPVHLADGYSYSVDVEVAAIMYAVDRGADVINISAGSPIPDPSEEAAIQYAIQQGVVIVAAAGNTGGEGGMVQYPAAYPGVIGVGACGRDGDPQGFSSTGAGLDVLAPGVDVPAWTADETSIAITGGHTGTSFATPFVSGLAALLRSVDPSASPRAVEDLLRSTAAADDSGWQPDVGYGVIDAGAAVSRAIGAAGRNRAPFTDVPSNHPYALAIATLADAGVVHGYGDGSFRANEPVSRQQFAKMILLALDRTPGEYDVSPFVDVPEQPGLYPDNYVGLAYRLGITRGTAIEPLRYSPYRSIGRAQVISMVIRAAEALHPGRLDRAPSSYQTPFRSFSRDHDAAAGQAYWNGLLDGLIGMGSTYDFWLSATRGEVAEILSSLVE